MSIKVGVKRMLYEEGEQLNCKRRCSLEAVRIQLFLSAVQSDDVVYFNEAIQKINPDSFKWGGKDIKQLVTEANATNCLSTLEKLELEATNDKGRTPLFIAAAYGNAEEVQRLIDQGASVDCKDSTGETPFDYILRNGLELDQANLIYDALEIDLFLMHLVDSDAYEDILLTLMKAGCSVDLYSHPLHKAAGNGYARVLEELLRRYPDYKDAVDEKGVTPLHKAVEADASGEGESYTRLTCVLLAAKASVNKKDASGKTPLHWACLKENFNEALIEELLKAEANPYAEDDDYFSPMELAMQERRARIQAKAPHNEASEIIELMRSQLAKTCYRMGRANPVSKPISKDALLMFV